MLAGRPNDASYLQAAKDAAAFMAEEGSMADFSMAEQRHRRGNYPALSVGLSYGNGQARPMNLQNSQHVEMLSRLKANSDINRIATFGSSKVVAAMSGSTYSQRTGTFALWAPKVYQYYASNLNALYSKYPELQDHRNFDRSIFAAATFNFGPKACTFNTRM